MLPRRMEGSPIIPASRTVDRVYGEGIGVVDAVRVTASELLLPLADPGRTPIMGNQQVYVRAILPPPVLRPDGCITVWRSRIRGNLTVLVDADDADVQPSAVDGTAFHVRLLRTRGDCRLRRNRHGREKHQRGQ